MKRFPIFGVILLASCARPQKPVEWKAPESLFVSVIQARETAVSAYYIARTESQSEAWRMISLGTYSLLAEIERARADTLVLLPAERGAFARALWLLEDYARALSDTARTYQAVRFTGLAPHDHGLEEACAIICVLAFQHGELEGIEGLLGRKFSQDELRAMKSSYGSVIMGGAGPDLRLWPILEPARPKEGLVLEVWAEDDTLASFCPILEVRGGGFVPPSDSARGIFYLYSRGSECIGTVRGNSITATKGRLDLTEPYIALPGPIFWRDTTPAPLPEADSVAQASKAYLSSIGVRFDSVFINQVLPFWVWDGRPGCLVFGNAIRGRKVTMFYAVWEEGKLLYADIMPSGGEFYGVEPVGMIDLDYDRISEVILSAEGEDTRFYIVLKKAQGVWWKAYASEPITEF
ncbi:MAG: hypothetical protein ABIM59_04375 [candidate division WOR-3 bacterium]